MATELYIGPEHSPGRPLKYAGRLGIPLVILYGGDEHAHGAVTLKNLAAGRVAAAAAEERGEWLAARAGRITVPRDALLASVRRALGNEDVG